MMYRMRNASSTLLIQRLRQRCKHFTAPVEPGQVGRSFYVFAIQQVFLFAGGVAHVKLAGLHQAWLDAIHEDDTHETSSVTQQRV